MVEDEFPGWLSDDVAEMEAEVRRVQLGRVAKILRKEILEMDINDTGRLYQSVRVNKREGTVTMGTPYGKFVNEGRSPGNLPPYEAIRKWVGHKLGITGRKEQKNVTWAIMSKIKNRGIPGKWILERAWKAVLSD